VTVKKRCDDGTIVELDADCPCAVTLCDDPDIQVFDSDKCLCVTVKKRCPDGTIVALSATCPDAPCEEPKNGCPANYRWSQEKCTCLLQSCPPGQFYAGGTCKYPENVIDVENDILFDTGAWGYDGVQALRNQLNDSTYKGLVKDYFKMYLTDQNTSYTCSDYNEWFETTYRAVTEELVAASGLQNGTSAMRSIDAWNHVMERMIQSVGTKRKEWLSSDPDIELVDTGYMHL
jgi:hypothetical protein